MPNIDVLLYAPFDTRNFFAPSTMAIAAITGTDSQVQVALVGGLTLVYTGTGFQFSGTQPTAGIVTGVQVLRADGAKVAEMDLTLAPWQFAEITGSGPLDSYNANGHRQIYSSTNLLTVAGNTFFQGGDQADSLQTFLGVDALLGGGGDDVVTASGNVYPQRVAPAGLTLDGGDGIDRLAVFSSIGADFSNASFRNFEILTIGNGTLLLSAAQLGKGGIALNATIEMFSPNTPQLLFNQVAGRAVDLSQFVIPDQLVQGTRMQVNGTAENDVQRGNARSADFLLGGGGNDRLYGGGGRDSMFGGTGDDILVAGDDPAGAGFPGSAGDELRGGDGNDRLFGGVGSVSMFGEAGDDVVNGGAGFAIISGGDGNDWLKGGSATFPGGFGGSFISSALDGGAGNDTLVSGAVGTWMIGGMGDDRYVVDHTGGRIEELANGGDDRVVTSVSVDLTTAGEVERIVLTATTGLAVTGTATANTMTGNLGADTLNGGAGNDTLSGREGADVLNGGLGNDTLTGGMDADLFVFETGSLRDVIADFADGVDRIDISNLMAVTDFADLVANHLRQSGANVVLDAGAGDMLVMRAVTLAQLDAGDFLI